MFKYYGLDWANVLLVPIHIWLLGSQRRTGFLVGMVSCCCSFTWSLMAESYANMLLAVILFFLHIRGWYKWKRISLPLCRRIYPKIDESHDERDQCVPNE